MKVESLDDGTRNVVIKITITREWILDRVSRGRPIPQSHRQISTTLEAAFRHRIEEVLIEEVLIDELKHWFPLRKTGTES